MVGRANAGSGPARLALHGSTIIVGAPLDGAGADEIRTAIAGRRAALISDTNVMPLHGGTLADALGLGAGDTFTVPAGEPSKTRDEWSRLTDAMLAAGFGRDSVVVAVGGGVVGDLAGFVAATYMRGVPVIQVPTTLLAMIDAAVGGKTGVDTPHGKNLVGAFHQPALVAADPRTLRTLPPRQIRNGLAEALKHAVITSEDELGFLLENAAAAGADPAVTGELVRRNVAMKHAVVSRDEREEGVRKVLNFGHTIGHAIEAVSGYAMLHGECVGIGMRVEAAIAEQLGLATAGLLERISAALGALGLPGRPSERLDAAAIVTATRTDKKARGARVEYSLFADVGTPVAPDAGYAIPVDDATARAALTAVLGG